jgi:RES domain-containing protein
MIVAYRVCKTRYPVFDGTGAEIAGGRWNSRGRPLIYCADSFAGALLEILIHANAPYGRNLLLNPAHPDFARLVLEPPVAVAWDARLFRSR